MAPLNPNTTLRLLIQYTSGGETHVAECRPDGVTTYAAAQTYADGLIPLMKAVMANADQVTGAYVYLAGSNVSNPIVITTGAGTAGDGVINDQSKSAFASYVGRSLLGRRVRFTIFTLAAYSFNDTRVYYGVVGAVWSNLGTYLGAEATLATAVDGNTTLWKSYVNFGRNSYFQRKYR